MTSSSPEPVAHEPSTPTSDAMTPPRDRHGFAARLAPAAGIAAIGCGVLILFAAGIALAKWVLVRSVTGLTGPLTGFIGGQERPLAFWIGCVLVFGISLAALVAAFSRRTITAAIVSAAVPSLLYLGAMTFSATRGVLFAARSLSDWAWTAVLVGIHDLAGPLALVAAIIAVVIAWWRLWEE